MRIRTTCFLALLGLAVPQMWGYTALPSGFLSCLNTPNSTCPLPYGTYQVDGGSYYPVANIGASGVTVQGMQSGGAYPTIQRIPLQPGSCPSGTCNPYPEALMTASPGVSATIEYLNFDGNRYGAGLACLAANANYYDLFLQGAGTVTVAYVNFMNAPGSAAWVDGTSSFIEYSNFSNFTESEAARSNGLILFGSSSEAIYNYIDFSGTAGIVAYGYGEWIYGNSLYVNRYEEPDNVPGGQLTLQGQSQYVYAGGNLIQGNGWRNTGSPVNGCATVSMSPPDGIEFGGSDQFFYDNEIVGFYGTIVNQTIGGIGMLNDSPITGAYISTSDPWNSSDSAKPIEENNYGIYARPSASYYSFEEIYLVGNSAYGVYLDDVNTATFSPNACFEGNGANIAAPGSTNVTYPTNYSACP